MTQILYGLHTVKAALKNKKRHHKCLFITDKSVEKLKAIPKALTVKTVSVDKIIDLVPEGAVHQQTVLETTPLAPLMLEDFCAQHPKTARLIVLDQVTDPQNMGAILRTCAAFKADGLFVTGTHTVDINSPLLAKIASGAVEHVPFIQSGNLAQAIRYLKSKDFWCYGLDEQGAPIQKMKGWPPKIVLIFGAEGKGLRPLTKKSCDQLVSLPTATHFPTLNVGATVSATLYATTS